MKQIWNDPDVKRSIAYLAISIGVAGVRKAVEYFRSRQNGH